MTTLLQIHIPEDDSITPHNSLLACIYGGINITMLHIIGIFYNHPISNLKNKISQKERSVVVMLVTVTFYFHICQGGALDHPPNFYILAVYMLNSMICDTFHLNSIGTY